MLNGSRESKVHDHGRMRVGEAGERLIQDFRREVDAIKAQHGAYGAAYAHYYHRHGDHYVALLQARPWRPDVATMGPDSIKQLRSGES